MSFTIAQTQKTSVDDFHAQPATRPVLPQKTIAPEVAKPSHDGAVKYATGDCAFQVFFWMAKPLWKFQEHKSNQQLSSCIL
ncbi:hypothetical protein [Permianibacter aggregans]|uniref:hypothetical protein n=1 Tax=Permianibacter aggregans TaxID=1510150 RepID=UPI001062304A|nr:hypothetical protein [Permianibacter aggregans]QGX39048.1 hypothetical protein E2H98_04980 [Permianibacter aggregans]